MNATNKTAIASVVMLVLGLGGGWFLSQWRTGTANGDHSVAARAVAPASAATGVATAGVAERKVLYWYDPMVPTQKFDKPGKSPFMEMQLVPRYADEADAGAKPGVSVSAHAQQSLGLRVAVADKRVLAASVDAVGTVLLNERDISIVQSRTSGFVERVYARAPGDVIAAGAPIVDLLVPEWLAAQQEFLAVRATGDAALTAAARQRLVLLGMPGALIDQVAASGKAQAIQTLTAPSGGLIAELMVRQGMTVGMGMTLARINGLGTVWVEAAVPEALAATVAPGQPAEVRLPAMPGQVITGKVTAVLPEANRDTRTLRVRVELPNPGLKLRAGMFAQIALQGLPQREAVTVPAESVVRTGRRAIVYLLDAPGRYRPVEVELGPEIGDRIVVRKGIDAGQQVVASGQFLIDSEATLQGVTARAAAAASDAASAAPKEYEVRGVVSEAAEGGVITLDHEPVPALKWPAMTMPFPLARPDLAKGLKSGDKVRFTFRQQGDENVITAIEKAKP
ncbi:MAG: efflux RND transporter periplasmic adaptor subunit [Aquincola sp.]|nr:efflux RND transporter periplasmic adaptor subunit [Aquincola sp.]